MAKSKGEFLWLRAATSAGTRYRLSDKSDPTLGVTVQQAARWCGVWRGLVGGDKRGRGGFVRKVQ